MATETSGGGARQPADATASSGKYHVLTELGRGGMAIVEAAIARGPAGFTKLVVLKKAREEFGEQPEAVRTFLNEARISARMNHPNVVQVYEVYEDQGLPVMVMEYLEGQSLALLMRRHFDDPTSSPALPLSVLCRTLEGLQYAHSLADFDGRALNLIHRDVSPQNIMVTYDGQVKLLDFGIAKLDNLSGETKTGIIKGKLGYMPLEQVEGRTLDNRADLFPIGVMIWEAVARRRMWENQSDAGVIKHILQKNIPCLRAAAPSVDEELVRICKKATAGERDERYSSARELLDDLQAFLEKSAGVATEHAIAQWINTSCSDLKTSARQEMDAKLALFSKQTGSRSMAQNARRSSTHATGESVRERTGSQQRRAAPDGATDEGFGGQTLSARFDAPRRRWAMLAAAVALAGGVLFMRQAVLEPKSGQGSLPTQRGAASGMGPQGSAAATSAVASSADGLKLAAPPPVMPSGAGQGVASDHDAASALAPGAAASLAARMNASLATAQPKAVQPKAVRRATPQRAVVTAAARPPSALVSESPAAPKPAASRCDTPFAVDAAGIKRYRRECLAR